MGDQTPPTGRETKRYEDLGYLDITHDAGTYRTVRCVEPIDGKPGRFLVLYVGGDTADVRGASEIEIATRAEHEEHLRKVADSKRRVRMAAALHLLAEAIDNGLPIPSRFEIDGICMDSPDDVRAAAVHFDVEATERDNGHRQKLTEAKIPLVGAGDLPEVQVRMWHLTRPAPAEAVES